MTNITKQLAAACGYENVTPEVRGFQSSASNGLVLDAKDQIERLGAALNEIERKYAAIMNDPPEWVGMTDEQLKWVREAWYGASLIARRALEQEADNGLPTAEDVRGIIPRS